ncbi:hypothetical protein ACFLRC_00745 [Candidatus Altiarchaeota archaeon]
MSTLRQLSGIRAYMQHLDRYSFWDESELGAVAPYFAFNLQLERRFFRWLVSKRKRAWEFWHPGPNQCTRFIHEIYPHTIRLNALGDRIGSTMYQVISGEEGGDEFLDLDILHLQVQDKLKEKLHSREKLEVGVEEVSICLIMSELWAVKERYTLPKSVFLEKIGLERLIENCFSLPKPGDWKAWLGLMNLEYRFRSLDEEEKKTIMADYQSNVFRVAGFFEDYRHRLRDSTVLDSHLRLIDDLGGLPDPEHPDELLSFIFWQEVDKPYQETKLRGGRSLRLEVDKCEADAKKHFSNHFSDERKLKIAVRERTRNKFYEEIINPSNKLL